MNTKKRLHSFTVPAVIVITLSVFLIWLLSVVLPVALIELRYDYHKILADFFGVSDIRGLLLPQFKLDLKGSMSKNTVNGITIPAIFVDEAVIYNVDPNNTEAYLSALKSGIAHASGTSFPGSGGLGYYFAHSSTPTFVRQFNAVFYLLDKLKTGDEVYIWHEGQRYDYRIYQKQVTDADDLSFLRQTYPTETVVLQTCWPPGTTTKRLLVFAGIEQN